MNIDFRLVRLARQFGWWWAAAAGLGTAAGVLAVLQAGLLSRLIQRVFLEQADRAQVGLLLWALLAAAVLRLALAWGGESAGSALARRAKNALRQRLAEHLLRLGPLYAQGEHTGELHSLAMEGIDALEAYFSQYLPGLITAVLIPLGILAFVFPLDPLSGGVLLLTGPLIPVFMALIGDWAQRLTQRQFASLGRMSAYFLDVIQGLTTLKTFGRSQEQVEKIRRAGGRYRQVTMQVLRVTFLSALTLEMLATLSTAIVAVEVGLRLLYGRIAFEPAFFILVLAPEYYAPLRALGARFHAGMAGATAARRLFQVLETPPLNAVGGAAAEAGAAAPSQAAPRQTPPNLEPPFEIVFEDVSFVYPGSDYPAVQGLNLRLAAGEALTLRGPSGSGKSTTAALLLALARPTQGRILVNGGSLDEIPSQVWQRLVAWSPQDPALIFGSVLDNLRLAHPQATLEQARQAARLAEADEFISALPQGYATPIGERGLRLSAGQAQRLALARAFLRDAPVLVLDEPTAHLDPENEAALRRAIARLVQGRTALIISHRPGAISAAGGTVAWSSGGRVIIDAADRQPEVDSDMAAPTGGGWAAIDAAAGGREAVAPPAAGLSGGGRSLIESPAGGETLMDDGASGLSSAAVMWRLMRLARPFWPVAAAMAAGAATTLSSVGLMAASAYILSAAALHPSVAALQIAIVGVRFFGVSRGLLRYTERYLSHDATFRLLAELRASFYQALEPIAPAGLALERSGDLLTRLVGDIAALENFTVRAAAPSGAALLTAVVMAWLLGGYAPSLAAAWLGLFAVAGIAAPWAARRLGSRPGRRSVAARSGLSAAWVDGVQSLGELTVFGAGETWVNTITAWGGRLSAAQQRLADWAAFQSALTPALGQLSLWAVLWLAIPLVRQGLVPGVMLAGLALAAQAGFEAAAPLPLAGQYWESSLRSARRLFSVTDPGHALVESAGAHTAGGQSGPIAGAAASRVASHPRAGAQSRLDLPQEGGGASEFTAESAGKGDAAILVVRNLRFAYPGEAAPAIDDFNLRLPVGGRLALLGPSGVGKSTLLGLLLRFWQPQSGEMVFMGSPIHAWPEAALRANLSVMQGATLFSATVADNLRLGYPSATQQQMEQAAAWAGIHETIMRLPQGYQTWIGEGGRRFSGGESQRLALARALLRPAPLLALDEPTAHLDPTLAKQALQGILAAAQGRTLLVVTHDAPLFAAYMPCQRMETRA